MLATSAQNKGGPNYVFLFFPMVKKIICQRGHGLMAPLNTSLHAHTHKYTINGPLKNPRGAPEKPGSVNLDQQTWISKPGSANLDQQTWISKPGSANLDQQTWISKPGSANLDQQTWISKPGSANLDQQTWISKPESPLIK